MAVVPLRLTLEMLEHLSVLAIHLRAVGILPVSLFALKHHAEPDLMGVVSAAKRRVVQPSSGRVPLERSHLIHQLLLMSRLDPVPRDGAKHHSIHLQADGRTVVGFGFGMTTGQFKSRATRRCATERSTPAPASARHRNSGLSIHASQLVLRLLESLPPCLR